MNMDKSEKKKPSYWRIHAENLQRRVGVGFMFRTRLNRRIADIAPPDTHGQWLCTQGSIDTAWLAARLQYAAELVRCANVTHSNFTGQSGWWITLTVRQLFLNIFVCQGKATGNSLALHVRSFMQSSLFAWGRFVQCCWPVILIASIIFLLALCIPLQNSIIETDIVKLWVEGEGILICELYFIISDRRRPFVRGTQLFG
jgi:hypothetical protein